MSWILAAILLLLSYNEDIFLASPTPMKLPGHTQKITPYIRHWEAANFDRMTLHAAHQKHIEQKRHRRKRELRADEYGPVQIIKLNFFAHDREFRLILHQDPLSVFASDVQIENTLGPMDYDISRTYSGALEDDENSYIHAVLTSDNLLDGTIETKTDVYYLEPSDRYSEDLAASGIHSIVYKVSDVRIHNTARAENCASERLHKQILQKDLNRRDSKRTITTNINESQHFAKPLNRNKRWLPEDLSISDNDQRDPPLPLDLDVPYNDDFNIFIHDNNHDDIRKRNELNKKHIKTSYENENKENSETWNRDRHGSDISPPFSLPTMASKTRAKNTRDRNIIVNNYNPNNAGQNMYTKHSNIIVNTYNRTNVHDNNGGNAYSDSKGNPANKIFNTNWTTMFAAENDRPSHKTHVEIITKNGATKKPNIIVNNYNPDIILAPNIHSPQFNNIFMTNLLSGTGQTTTYETGTGKNGHSLYNRKITCMLYLQADHTFFQKMGSDEASIEAITRHVQRANSIYKNTDFNNDGKPDNITFMIKRIKVHNQNAVKDPSYRFPGNYGVEKFLELFSEEDYDAFCLAYMFTYRDFEMGTLGLAWTGDLKNAGGVCEKNGHYRGSLKSLNTGIVTLLNYGKHVPPAVSHVTLAHEIGHNFGSPHDPEQCTPGGEDGNFIMFARATSGDKKNNNKFSPCSLKSIEPVLNTKARSVKGCFTEPQTSICGNGVVEPGEQCDCGWEEDCKDSCCFPMSRHPRIDEKPCTLTPRSMCSPSQGPCCTSDCKLKYGDKCRDDNGCRDPSFCNGHMPQCPPSINKPNKTICNKEFVCYMGDCTGSICLAYGLESCQCIPGPNDDKIKSCELCCKLPGEKNPCRSSFEWNDPPFDVPDMYAKPGTPCNDYNGYCDVFQKCREVDPSGPLATLRKLLLSEESIATFKKWTQQNWYTVALAMVGIFVLLILSTKLLTKRSNLKLKSVTIIHSATTETVRLPEDNNGVIVHTAVRTKVPFKKKVRGERSRIANPSKNNNNNNTTKGNNKLKSNIKRTKNSFKSKRSDSKDKNYIIPKVTDRIKKNRQVGVENQITEQPSLPTGTATTIIATTEKITKDKKVKDLKKRNKEVIDYSKTSGQGTVNPTLNLHTNTFGKVQKWLLESPIMVQPLSHIEHSKARKVISKSQSTPERLTQKTHQKTKSVSNLNNEKVKLQVVYKPPFKFALKLSKNTKFKTNVINNGASNKLKRQVRSGVTGAGTANENIKGIITKNSITDSIEDLPSKRPAVLLITNNKDNHVLALNEPNYETLNTKLSSLKKENEFYENVINSQTVDEHISDKSSSATVDSQKHFNSYINAPNHFKISNKNIESHTTKVTHGGPPQRSHSYNRSNSLSSNQLSVWTKKNQSNSSNPHAQLSPSLNRKYSSTQNLVNLTQNNLAKSKKRRSLNLKSSGEQEKKQVFSNLNLRHEASMGNLQNSFAADKNLTQLQQIKQPLPVNKSATPTVNNHQMSPYSSPNFSQSNFCNIDDGSAELNTCASTYRAANNGNNRNSNNYMSSTNYPIISDSEIVKTPIVKENQISRVQTNANSNKSNSINHHRTRSIVPQTKCLQFSSPLQNSHNASTHTKCRSNSTRQHLHNNHPPPVPPSSTFIKKDTTQELIYNVEAANNVENQIS